MANPQFVIEPSLAIIRAVLTGDNALSPSSPNKIAFDAYSAFPYQYPILAGVVADSALTQSGSSSNYTRLITVNFGITLPNTPSYAVAYYDGTRWLQNFFYNNNYEQNSGAVSGNAVFSTVRVTTSSITFGVYVTHGSGTPSIPQQYSYRVFYN